MTTKPIIATVWLQWDIVIVSNTVKAEVHKYLSFYYGGYSEFFTSFVLC